MEDGTGARASHAKAAVAFAVLSLLPAALSGSAPSHASAVLPSISPSDFGAPTFAGAPPWSTLLFGAFRYDRGLVQGTYVQFAYDAKSGAVRSILGIAGENPVLYVASMQIAEFYPTLAEARGPIFEAQGYPVSITAHDDPTILLEIRSVTARVVTIELPASAANVSLFSTPGSWPASSVSFGVGGDQARFLLGAGSFNVTGTTIQARMAGSDLLVFKTVPIASAYKAEWRGILDAIRAGQVVAEVDVVATVNGRWVQNSVRYRIDLNASPLVVTPGRAAVQVESTRHRAAIVLIAFDPATMPAGEPMRLSVRTNGSEVRRTNDTLNLLYASHETANVSSYALLPFPGTVMALYLPSFSAFIDITSIRPAPPAPAFDPGSDLATIGALFLVSVAAARMLRRREE